MLERELVQLRPKDYASDEDVRWCPGCGDYAILNRVRAVAAKLALRREDTVFVSGIGCAARFPYYMNTYGFHAIHGRAAPIATGVKLANPKLSVWVVAGDGDLLSIGGNHLMHVLRRNVDLNILLFNNRVYGLTKGQYSPTSEVGMKTLSSPAGTLDLPLNPLSIALASEAGFVGRGVDVDESLAELIERAATHKGSSFVEIYQDCNVFNHGAFAHATDRKKKEDHLLRLRHGQPMVFGSGRDKGIRLCGHRLEVVDLGGPGGMREEDLLLHDETDESLAFMLSRLRHPEFPEPVGVLYVAEDRCYEDLLEEQVKAEQVRLGEGTLEELWSDGEIYVVDG